jgi:hypothetical protein
MDLAGERFQVADRYEVRLPPGNHLIVVAGAHLGESGYDFDHPNIVANEGRTTMEESTWKVKYQCIEDHNARRPFWKREAYVRADSRKAAIEKVRAVFGPPRYGNHTASPAPNAKPNSTFS